MAPKDCPGDETGHVQSNLHSNIIGGIETKRVDDSAQHYVKETHEIIISKHCLGIIIMRAASTERK